MPFCPKCRGEFVEGIEVCPVCGVELVEELGKDVRYMSADELKEALAGKELVAIRRGFFDTVKELHQLLLENQIANIILEHSQDDDADGYTKLYNLFVAEEDAPEALAIIEQYWVATHPETAELDERTLGLVVEKEEGKIVCPACGAEIDASATECPSCGLFLGAVPKDEPEQPIPDEE